MQEDSIITYTVFHGLGVTIFNVMQCINPNTRNIPETKNIKPNSVDCEVKLELCKGDGYKKPCPEWVEGLVMESRRSKLFRFCPPTDIHDQNEIG